MGHCEAAVEEEEVVRTITVVLGHAAGTDSTNTCNTISTATSTTTTGTTSPTSAQLSVPSGGASRLRWMVRYRPH